MWMYKTILSLLSMMILISCAPQAPEASAGQTIPRTGDKSARVPWLPTAELQFIDLQAAGFSLAIQQGYEFDTDESSINLSDKAGELIISLNGRPYIASIYTLETFLDKYIAEMAARGGSFDQGEPYEITIDGISGIAVDLNGTFLDLPIAGKAIAISPGKDFIVFGLAMSNLSGRENGWRESGSQDFDAILDSIQFKDEVKR